MLLKQVSLEIKTQKDAFLNTIGFPETFLLLSLGNYHHINLGLIIHKHITKLLFICWEIFCQMASLSNNSNNSCLQQLGHMKHNPKEKLFIGFSVLLLSITTYQTGQLFDLFLFSFECFHSFKPVVTDTVDTVLSSPFYIFLMVLQKFLRITAGGFWHSNPSSGLQQIQCIILFALAII